MNDQPRVIDTHAHVVGSDIERYPLRNLDDGLHTDWIAAHALDADDFATLATNAGVDKFLLVQALSAHDFDNRYIVDSVTRLGEVAGAVVGIDLASEGCHAALDAVADLDEVVGVRIFDMGTGTLEHPSAPKIAERCAQSGLPVSLMTVESQLPLARELARAVPSGQFVLDHAGLPGLAQLPEIPESLRWVGDAGNVTLKMTTYNFAGSSSEQGATLLERVMALVGAERMLWGSDFPHSFVPGYGEQVQGVIAACAGLSESERVAVLAENACRLYPRLAADRKSGAVR